MGRTLEIVCVRFGQKETSCPVLRRGGTCIECGNARYIPREPIKKEEEKSNGNNGE